MIASPALSHRRWFVLSFSLITALTLAGCTTGSQPRVTAPTPSPRPSWAADAVAADNSPFTWRFTELCVTQDKPFGSSPTEPLTTALSGAQITSYAYLGTCHLPGVARRTGRSVVVDFDGLPTTDGLSQVSAAAAAAYPSAAITSSELEGTGVSFVLRTPAHYATTTQMDKRISALTPGLQFTPSADSPGLTSSVDYAGPHLSATAVRELQALVAAATRTAIADVVLRPYRPKS